MDLVQKAQRAIALPKTTQNENFDSNFSLDKSWEEDENVEEVS